MKNIFVLLAFVVTFISCQKESTEYIINAKIEGVPDGMKVSLKSVIDNNPVLVDTTFVADGTFSFKGSVEEADIYVLMIQSVPSRLPFILENKKMNILMYKDSLGLSKIEGSEPNNVAQKYMKQLSEFRKRNDSIIIEFNKARRTNDTLVINDLRIKSQAIKIDKAKYNIDFFKENTNSLFGVLLLENLVKTKALKPAELKEYFNLIPVELQNSKPGKRVKEILNRTLATEIGAIAPDFMAPDPQGNQISLDEIKGKVTIIDFWASWCGPCRKENPNVVRLYEKYHEKGLEIIGVSLDGNTKQKDPKKAWLDAIEKDGLKWHQVSNLSYFYDPVAKQYNVQAIPATFILDSEGKIIAKNLRGPALDQKISELLD